MAPFNSSEELLRMNLLCRGGKITGVINASDLDQADIPFREIVPKSYHVRGAVENGIGRIWIQEYVGTEPYHSETVDLNPEDGNLIWKLDTNHSGYIRWFPKQQILERHNMF